MYIIALGSVLYIMALLTIVRMIVSPRSWAQRTTGPLMGERRVSTAPEANKLAKDIKAEAASIWSEPKSNWATMNYDQRGGKWKLDDLIVEARRVNGSLSSSGILLTRAAGTIAGADPDELFHFFISTEKKDMPQLLRDATDPTNYIEHYDWKGAGRGSFLNVQEHFKGLGLPGMKERNFVVLNGRHLKDRFFFSKSIVHDARPGFSPYFDGNGAGALHDDHTSANLVDTRRALHTFYLSISHSSDKTGSVIKMVNYVDMQMGSTMMNWLTCKGFYPLVYNRLEQRFGLTE